MKNNQSTSAASLFKSFWKDDLLAGFNVSLIALPLCLGIALASGFPPVAGLFAAIVGGLIVSRINGSNLTITGPAAGLIVVNLSAIEMLGQGDNAAGYRYALAAILIAGLIIIVMGFLKAGKIGDFFPGAAVHGMLASIGIIIIVKQLFVAVAVRAHGHEFYEVIEEIPIALAHANPEVVIVAVVSLLILIFHPKIKSKLIRAIPAPVWVLVFAIPLEFLMDFEHEHELIFLGEHHKVGPQLLVHLPDNILDGFALPDFGKIMTGAFWIAVMSIALVTAIETLLSAIAIDSIDPQKRKTNLDKDLKGLGAGSALSGLIGGLPMISEIVRSSANVGNGAKSQWSNFFHGGFLLIFLLFGAPILNHIPLAALAAMLIFTGYRLASPKEFIHVYKTGKSELMVFVFTIFMVLMTDLLVGIGAGILLNMAVILYNGTRLNGLFKARYSVVENGEKVIVKVQRTLVFSNYLSFKKVLSKYAQKHIDLDFSELTYIDHTVLLHLQKQDLEFANRDLEFHIINQDHLVSATDNPYSAKKSSSGEIRSNTLSEIQVKMTEIAQLRQWRFVHKTSTKFQEFTGFKFNKTGRVQYIQNRLEGKMNDGKFVFGELLYDTEMQTRSGDGLVSKLVLTPDHRSSEIPLFTLEKEGFLDRMMEFSGLDDIDFEKHPEFSNFFLLRGENESRVRDFFNEDLILFLEKFPYYHVESNGRAILIYRFDKKGNTEQILDLLKFGEDLMALLNKEETIALKN